MRRGNAEAQASDVVRDSEARLEEATGLARAIDLTVADTLIAPISQIRPATYLGKGKVEEITGLIAGHDSLGDGQIDRPRQADGFLKPRIRVTQRMTLRLRVGVAAAHAQVRADDDHPPAL